MIALLRELDRDLLRDFKSGTYNLHKIGGVVVLVLWSGFMIVKQPDSVEMWFAYSGVLLGASAIQYGQKRRNEPAGKCPIRPGAVHENSGGQRDGAEQMNDATGADAGAGPPDAAGNAGRLAADLAAAQRNRAKLEALQAVLRGQIE